MDKCYPCDVQNESQPEEEKKIEDILEKCEELFKMELEEGILKQSIPILVEAISKFRQVVDQRLIKVATQVVIAMAEEEMRKHNIEKGEKGEESFDEDSSSDEEIDNSNKISSEGDISSLSTIMKNNSSDNKIMGSSSSDIPNEEIKKPKRTYRKKEPKNIIKDSDTIDLEIKTDTIINDSNKEENIDHKNEEIKVKRKYQRKPKKQIIENSDEVNTDDLNNKMTEISLSNDEMSKSKGSRTPRKKVIDK